MLEVAREEARTRGAAERQLREEAQALPAAAAEGEQQLEAAREEARARGAAEARLREEVWAAAPDLLRFAHISSNLS